MTQAYKLDKEKVIILTKRTGEKTFRVDLNQPLVVPWGGERSTGERGNLVDALLVRDLPELPVLPPSVGRVELSNYAGHVG